MKHKYHLEEQQNEIQNISHCQNDSIIQHNFTFLTWYRYMYFNKKNRGFKLVSWAETSYISEIIRPCKCVPHVNKMSNIPYNQANRFIIKNAVFLSIIYIIYLIFMTQKNKNYTSEIQYTKEQYNIQENTK
jgi:hypothetical protein